jgi:phosphoglycerate dehydrogenase-like enzyme
MNPLRLYVDFVPPSTALDLLREGTRGHDLMFARNPTASVLAKAERDPQMDLADVAFGQPDSAAVLAAPCLKWVHVSSSGITRYDTPAFRSELAGRGIRMTNSATVYEEACALHVLSFLLAQSRCLPRSLRTRTANGTPDWFALRGACVPLRGQRVLIVGFGAIARRLTAYLQPLGVLVTAYRRNPRGDEGVPMVCSDGLAQALGEADQVIDILPESAETAGFFGADRFAAMKRGVVFHNIGRGATVDQEALLAALRSGQVGTAWLDVTSPEPLPDGHPLWAEPDCHITPHVAGGHAEESVTLVRHFLDNLRRFEKGETLLDRVI